MSWPSWFRPEGSGEKCDMRQRTVIPSTHGTSCRGLGIADFSLIGTVSYCTLQCCNWNCAETLLWRVQEPEMRKSCHLVMRKRGVMVWWISRALEFKKLLSVGLSLSFENGTSQFPWLLCVRKWHISFQPIPGYSLSKIYVNNAGSENIFSYP